MFLINCYWSIVHLQCHVGFSCVVKWISHTYILALLGLRCCKRVFSSCREWGLLLCYLMFSLQWLLLLQSVGSRWMGFSSCSSRALEHRLSSWWWTGLVAPRHVESFWTRNWICVPCISRWILIHCTTREVPAVYCLNPLIFMETYCPVYGLLGVLKMLIR